MSQIKQIGTAPDPGRDIRILDKEGGKALRAGARAALRVVQSDAPGSFGTSEGLRTTTRKTQDGHEARVAPARGRAQILRWVNRGTGLLREGPGPKRSITASRPFRKMTLPGGAKRLRVKGQAPNPFMERNRARAAAAASAAIAAAGRQAADRLRRSA